MLTSKVHANILLCIMCHYMYCTFEINSYLLTYFHFYVSGPVLYPGGDSVRAEPSLLVSGDTSDGDRLPVIMAACPLTGRCVCCGWLQFVTRGLWLLQSACERAPSCSVMEAR